MLLRKHYAAVFVLTIFLQFTRQITKARRCNGFVAGPVSLQFTGHPFAKPRVPCVVASQLCFVHERASTSSC